MQLSRFWYSSVIVILTLAFLVSCASSPSTVVVAPAPSWMVDREKDYPDSRFLCAEGTGITKKQAEADAVAALAKIFKVSVNVNTVAKTSYLEFSSGQKSTSEFKRNLDETIEIKAAQELVNVMFTEPYTDRDGNVNVLAYIDRAKTATIYESTLNALSKSVNDYLRRANASPKSIERYALYEAAYRSGQQMSKLLMQLRVISFPTAERCEKLVELPKWGALRDQSRQGLFFTISVEGDPSGKVSGVLSSLLSDIGFIQKSGKGLLVKGSWSVVNANLSSDFKSVRWTLMISLVDETGATVGKFFKEDRSNAATVEQAKALALNSVRTAIQDDFVARVLEYVSQLVNKTAS